MEFEGRELIDLRKIPEAETISIKNELYKTHSKIFSGVSREVFEKYVFSKTANCTKVEIFYGKKKSIAGYCAFHRYHKTINGKKLVIYRAEAGLRKEYRGGGQVAAAGIKNAVKYKLSYPQREVYYFGTLIHPSSYCMLTRKAALIYPTHDRRTPKRIRNLMITLADEFGLEQHPENPMVRKVGWTTIESDEDRKRHANRCPEAAEYFKEQNPDYKDGYGLLTLVPINLGNLAKSASRILDVFQHN